MAVKEPSWQPLASSQDPIAQNNAVFYAVSAVSFARECVGSVWSDLANSNLYVSRSFGWRLRFLALAFWVLSTKFCSTLKKGYSALLICSLCSKMLRPQSQFSNAKIINIQTSLLIGFHTPHPFDQRRGGWWPRTTD